MPCKRVDSVFRSVFNVTHGCDLIENFNQCSYMSENLLSLITRLKVRSKLSDEETILLKNQISKIVHFKWLEEKFIFQKIIISHGIMEWRDRWRW